MLELAISNRVERRGEERELGFGTSENGRK